MLPYGFWPRCICDLLGDGEETCWNRADFTGVLDVQYLPDWAQEKLEELRGPQQKQDSGQIMGSMS